MSRRPGRPSRTYQIRVRTERRDPIDYAALARAALEQAAMNQRRETTTNVPPPVEDNDPDGDEQPEGEGDPS